MKPALQGIYTQLRTALLALILVVSIIASCATALAQSTPTAKGPRVDTLVYVGVTTVDKGIKGVETGEFDAFMWEVLPEDLERIGVDLGKIKLVPAVRYVDLLDINPYSDPNERGVCGLATRLKDGVVVFNPFALREVRFQLNNLVNRKYVSFELLKGGGEPAFTFISVSHPAWHYMRSMVENLGLREEGSEILALQKIREAMQVASSCMAKFGYSLVLERDPATGREVWTLVRPDGSKEPVKIVFLIRIEDERKLIGDYIAAQLEKAGFLVERKYIERAQFRPLVRDAEPRNLEWHLYTHSDSMLRSLWVHEDLGYWYTAAYGPLPASAGRWEYTVDHAKAIGDPIQGVVDKIATDLRRGRVATTEEYWLQLTNGTSLAVQQSLRVFIIGLRNFYVVGQRVRDMAYSPIFGITIEWPWRTALTPDRTLRVAIYASAGSLFMYEWNPIVGVGGVYGSYIWYYVRDYAWLRHPSTLTVVPVRTTWSIEKTEVKVPTSAFIYDPNKHTWVNVPEGKSASYVIDFNFKLGNYHDGSQQTLLDILTQFAWYAEWAFKSGDEDPWYHASVAENNKYILDDVVGVEILNSTTIRVYGTYGRFYSLDETAAYYLGYFWPSWHPLLVLGMEYCVIRGGPVTGIKYGWLTKEGERTLDAMNPEHVADVAEAVRLVGRGEYSPPHLRETSSLMKKLGQQVQDVAKAAASLASFVTDKKHLAVSNGPYYINKYIPEQMYVELKAFRDATYPFEPEYWLRAFEISKLVVVGTVKVPALIVVGRSARVEVPLVKYVVYPDEGERGAIDAGAELLVLGPGDKLIGTVGGIVVEEGPPTVWVFELKPDLTSKLEGLKKVVLEFRFWRVPGIYDVVGKYDVDVLFVETPTPTVTPVFTTVMRTTTEFRTVTSPLTVTPEVPVITAGGAALAVLTFVIGLLIGVLVLKKR